MKRRKNGGFSILISLFALLFAAIIITLFFYNKIAFAIGISAFVVLCIAILSRYAVVRRSIARSIVESAQAMADTRGDALKNFTCPVVIISNKDTVLWCNKAFTSAAGSTDTIGCSFLDLIGENNYSKLTHFKTVDAVLFGKHFKMFLLVIRGVRVVYLVDQTELKRIASEYYMSRPVVALLEIDSLDQLLSNMRDSRKAQICGEIQDIIENWFSGTTGIMRTISNSRFMLVFEERHLRQYEADRFKILDLVRNYEIEENKALTLSVGIGYGCDNLKECEELAKHALDMSLSRGGDQVAIKSPKTDYKFYGGVKAVAEKGSRVRARIMSGTLKDLILDSSNVIITGHRFSDLDCIGACVALAVSVRTLGIDAYVSLDKSSTMAGTIVDYLKDNDMSDIILSGQQAVSVMDEKSLVIVADTHRAQFLECPEVYNNATRVAVIDHHRKATDFIENALLFYNETVASSVCEMITEMCQYMSSTPLTRVQANCLLSGIMLDTKNFILGTGVRTFEAAAYLRKCGADPVLVKKMFAESMEIYKKKYAVIASTQIYKECAIALNPENSGDSRLVAAQAADELLSVNNVKASFVIFGDGVNTNISARSYGEINVQLIMESLGGGGHRTMAACTLKNKGFEQALLSLQKAIDKYDSEG